jgi:hypothetical protein
MTSNIRARIRRVLNPSQTREAVHFHLGREGQPFVCDVSRCDSPALTLDELDA